MKHATFVLFTMAIAASFWLSCDDRAGTAIAEQNSSALDQADPLQPAPDLRSLLESLPLESAHPLEAPPSAEDLCELVGQGSDCVHREPLYYGEAGGYVWGVFQYQPESPGLGWFLGMFVTYDLDFSGGIDGRWADRMWEEGGYLAGYTGSPDGILDGLAMGEFNPGYDDAMDGTFQAVLALNFEPLQGELFGFYVNVPEWNGGIFIGEFHVPGFENDWPMPPCEELFDTWQVCDHGPDYCSVYAILDGANCHDYCAAHGAVCLGAAADVDDTCLIEDLRPCEEPAGDMICTCALY